MSLFTMDTDTVIAGMVDGLLPENSEGKALHVALDVRRSVYCSGLGDDFTASRAVHFIIAKPSNYKKVFAAVRDDWKNPTPEEYKLTSSHDSCWRTDGFSGTLADVWRDLEKELDDQKAPKKDRTSHCSFLLTCSPELVTVETTNIPASEGNGRYKLTSIKKA
jgi:hypothetical protein